MSSVPFSLGLVAVLSLAVGGVAAGEADARMYECRQGGQLTFSDQPCAGQERTIDVPYEEPSASGAAAARQAVRAEENAVDAVAQAAVLDAQILDKQQEIARLQTERDAQVAQLQQQVFQGTENLDQNAWQAQMTQRIASVEESYNARIVAANAQLDALQSQRAALGGAGAANP